MRYKRRAICVLFSMAVCLGSLIAGANHAKIASHHEAAKKPEEGWTAQGDDMLDDDAYLSQVFAMHTEPFLSGASHEVAQEETTLLTDTDAELKASLSNRINYMEDYFPRYKAYALKYPKYPHAQIVAEVNMNLDRPFYTDIQTIEDPDDYLVLVNKYNRLPDGYVPEAYGKDDGRVLKMRGEAQEHFELMKIDAASNGANLWICSGYRSYSVQDTLYANQKRNNPNYYDLYQARAGHSEHQTGLAADFNSTALSFQYTKEYKWLAENAHKYGFVLRYPADKKGFTGYAFEPWHWRYVGTFAATLMYEENLCFEEYHAIYLMDTQEPAE